MFIKRIFAIFIGIISIFLLVGCGTSSVPVPDLKIEESDHVYGNPNAPLTLIEYSDFECPFCKTFHTTARRLVDDNNGKLNWVYRHFPLSSHDPLATQEATATECAADLGGNDKFWEYADLLYENTKSNGRGLDENKLTDFAEEIDLNKEEFQKCLDSGKFKDKIRSSIKSGTSNGVSGTPGTFLLDNATGETQYISGAQPYDAIQSLIDSI